MTTNFFGGILIGLLVSAPLGAVGVICIQQTLKKGVKSGFLSALGAILGDTFYAIVVAFGIKFISDFIITYECYIGLIGGIVLGVIGYKLVTKNTVVEYRHPENYNKSSFQSFLSVLFITLTNPAGIFFFGISFSKFNIGHNFQANFALLAGVLSGTILWWLTLTSTVNAMRRKFKLRTMFYVNKFTGYLIVGFSLFLIISTLIKII